MHLIAHRGGIVDDQHPENSSTSIEAAIARGYWMIEVDVRRSRDGQALLQHDPTFTRFYNDPRKVDEMTWAEIAQLKTATGAHPVTFDELCRLCAGRIRLMLDVKSGTFPDEFYQGLVDTLRQHKMLDSTYCLSANRVWEISKGAALRAGNLKEITGAIADGSFRTRYLFEGPHAIDESVLATCRDKNITVVAALNTFGYNRRATANPMDAARTDAERLLHLGVRYFQIDSIYDRFFLG